MAGGLFGGNNQGVGSTPVKESSDVNNDVARKAAASPGGLFQEEGGNVEASQSASSSANNAEKFALEAEGWAVGEQDGVAVDSDSEYYDNNSKYYSEEADSSAGAASSSASAASSSATAAANSATAASTSAGQAANSATAAATSASNAAAAETAAEAAQTAAETAETNAETAQAAAETAETNAEAAQTAAEAAQAAAETAETNAETAETNAETAQTAAETAQTGAETAETNAGTQADQAEAWAVGEIDGVAVGETADQYENNAKYYAEQAAGHAGNANQFLDVNTEGFADPDEADASGGSSIALGIGSTASGLRSSAFGLDAEASDTDATAFGANAEASGADATAIGNQAKATKADALAIGENARAFAQQSTAIGQNAIANNTGDEDDDGSGPGGAVAIGNNAEALYTNSGAIGSGAAARAANIITIGRDDNDGARTPHTVELNRQLVSTDNDLAVATKKYVDDVAASQVTAGTGLELSDAGVISISDGGVGTTQLADDAVTQAKIADNAVGRDQLADSAVGNAEIAPNAVHTNEIQDGAVTSAKIADGAVNSAQIHDLAIDTNHIADDQITHSKMAHDSVGTAEIMDNAVTQDKIANDAVGPLQIAAEAVNVDHLDVDSHGAGQVLAVADDGHTLEFIEVMGEAVVLAPKDGSVYNATELDSQERLLTPYEIQTVNNKQYIDSIFGRRVRGFDDTNGIEIASYVYNNVSFSYTPSQVIEWDRPITGLSWSIANNSDYQEEFINSGITTVDGIQVGTFTETEYVATTGDTLNAQALTQVAKDPRTGQYNGAAGGTRNVSVALLTNENKASTQTSTYSWGPAGFIDDSEVVNFSTQSFDAVRTTYTVTVRVHPYFSISNLSGYDASIDNGGGSANFSISSQTFTANVTGATIYHDTQVSGNFESDFVRPTSVSDESESNRTYSDSQGWNITPSTRYKVWSILATDQGAFAVTDLGTLSNSGYATAAAHSNLSSTTAWKSNNYRFNNSSGSSSVNGYLVAPSSGSTFQDTDVGFGEVAHTSTSVNLGHSGHTVAYTVYTFSVPAGKDLMLEVLT